MKLDGINGNHLTYILEVEAIGFIGDFNVSAACNHHYFLKWFQVFLLTFLLPLWLFLHLFLLSDFSLSSHLWILECFHMQFSFYPPLFSSLTALNTVCSLMTQNYISCIDCSHNVCLLNSSIWMSVSKDNVWSSSQFPNCCSNSVSGISSGLFLQSSSKLLDQKIWNNSEYSVLCPPPCPGIPPHLIFKLIVNLASLFGELPPWLKSPPSFLTWIIAIVSLFLPLYPLLLCPFGLFLI